MRTLRVLLALLLCLSCEGRADVPPFTGSSLPVPPMQGKPWTPPATTFPSAFVDDAARMFSYGVADPRGCSYREIRIVVGSSTWGDAQTVRTHGWVLPSAPGAARYGVAWNGLVYPLVSSGEEADLHSDVDAMIIRGTSEPRWGGRNYAFAEAAAVRVDLAIPFRVVLLLRLGEGALAERLWPVANLDPRAEGGGNPVDPEIRFKSAFLDLAGDILWFGFDRALGAHRRGDDRLAAIDCRKISEAAALVDAEAIRREIYSAKEAADHDHAGKAGGLAFLSEVPALLADSERRVAQAPYVPVLSEEARKKEFGWEVPGAAAPKPRGQGDRARIAALIRDLELVSARQDSQPGSVFLLGDAIVQALIVEGEDAVDPLLDCMENDTRLTRSVGFHRDFFRRRHVLSVSDAAYAVLASSVDLDFFRSGVIGDEPSKHDEADRKELVARIRAYWKTYGGLPLEERWYRILADPATPDALWWATMEKVIQPGNVTTYGGGVSVTRPLYGIPAVLRGASLRSKKEPSITSLLVVRLGRAEADLASAKEETAWLDSMRGVADIGKTLAIWDGEGGRSDLTRAGAVLLDGFSHPPSFVRREGALAGLIHSVAGFFREATVTGDAAAMETAAAWLYPASLVVRGDQAKEIFPIAWKHAEAPAMRKAISSLSAEGGALSPPWAKDAPGWKLCASRLLVFPEFREAVQRGLSRKEPAGTVEVEASDFRFETLFFSGSLSNGATNPASRPAVGTRVAVRFCDLCAFVLYDVPGAPPFLLTGSVEERDRGVAACAAFLSKKGAVLTFPQDW